MYCLTHETAKAREAFAQSQRLILAPVGRITNYGYPGKTVIRVNKYEEQLGYPQRISYCSMDGAGVIFRNITEKMKKNGKIKKLQLTLILIFSICLSNLCFSQPQNVHDIILGGFLHHYNKYYTKTYSKTYIGYNLSNFDTVVVVSNVEASFNCKIFDMPLQFNSLLKSIRVKKLKQLFHTKFVPKNEIDTSMPSMYITNLYCTEKVCFGFVNILIKNNNFAVPFYLPLNTYKLLFIDDVIVTQLAQK